VPAHLLVGDRRQVLLVEEMEAELLRLRRGEHAHSDADKSERDRAAPDRAHAASIPEQARVSTSDSGANVLLQTRALVPRKASPPSGGVDSSGRFSGPKSFRGRGKGCGCCGEATLVTRRETVESCEKLASVHRLGC